MTKVQVIGLSLGGVAALSLLIMAFPFSRKVAFCTGIVMPYDVKGVHVVFVPAAEHDNYNRAFIAFVRRNGFMAASNEQALPEEGRPETWFKNLNSSGCNGSAYISSSNIAHPDEFMVGFHSNQLLGGNQAGAIERVFLAEFGARYRIRLERDVARERGY